MTFYSKTIKRCLLGLNSSENGLSLSEVDEKTKEYGKNEIAIKGVPMWRKLIEPFANIFMLVLFVAAVMSLIHRDYTDALIIFSIIIINAVVYYVQQISTDRVLRSLRERNKVSVMVIREKKTVNIDVSDLVPGDVMLLDEGEKVPADARLMLTESFRVDESQLTGESFPISKQTDPVSIDKEVNEQTNMIFQGSFVVSGSTRALVVATGNDTEFGKLAALSVNPIEVSPVQKKIDKLISAIIRMVALIAVIAFALSLYRGMGFSDGVRYVLALSVSAVPESLPVAITVVLVLGMRRMAKKKALVKTTSAIETIGGLTVIATDKTGTLTENKLTVQQIWAYNDDDALISCMTRSLNYSNSKVSDPLDVALIDYSKSKKRNTGDGLSLSLKLPFDQDYSMSGNVLDDDDGGLTLWLKGAPESILSRSKLTKADRDRAMSALHSMASNGLRVIAFAHVEVRASFKSFNDMKDCDLVFDGFVGVADILRLEAKDSIELAQRAGIGVCMVTGDHFETAFHIGKKLGLVDYQNQVLDCRKLSKFSDSELASIINGIKVFARVTPDNKYRILTLLKEKNIVAMTGDGVNDVPALAKAHVGIAMGSGTSIAKDAGDIILLDSNFKSIVDAVHEGRAIYSNIKRMVAYLLSTNAGEVLVALSSLVIGVPVPLLPVQILWVNLVTDTCLVIPLGLEPARKRNMDQKPQSPNSPLFSKYMASRILLVSVVMAAVTMVTYLYFIDISGHDYARTVVFQTLVIMQWTSAFCYRSDYESVLGSLKRFSLAFYIGIFVVILMQLIAMSDFMRPLLHLSPISMQDNVVSVVIAIVVPLVVVEFHKFIGRKFFNKGYRRAV